MRILREEIEVIDLVDNKTLLNSLDRDLKDTLNELSTKLYSDIMSDNLLRIFYDKKSLIDIKPIYKEDSLKEYVISDYTGHTDTCQPDDVVETIRELIIKLNFSDKKE